MSSIKETEETRVYKRRLWILGIFSFITLLQTAIWGTFGPIIDSVQAAFRWTDSTNALMQAWGPVMATLLMVPITWLNEHYGLRKGILLSTFMMTLGTAVRCITSSNKAFTILANVGAILNGAAGCLVLSLPAMVACTWFPTKERTTATAVALLSGQLGSAAMFLTPLIVKPPPEVITDEDVMNIKNDIMRLMYIGCGILCIVFASVILYFPDKPPKPPSLSAAVTEHEEYFKSIKILLKNSQFMLVAVTFGVSYGIPVVWISVMNFNLGCIGLSQEEVSWLAISATLVSALSGFVVARITDYMYGHLRFSILALLSASSLFFYWFLLLEFELIPTSKGQLYAAIVGGLALEYSSVPLLIELGVELAYPCQENVTGALMVFIFNAVASIFLLLFMIPTECYYWANYVLVGCTSLTLIPMLLVKEKYNRSSLDRNNLST